MFHKFEEGKDQLISSLIDKINTTYQADDLSLCCEFTRQCFGTVALDQLLIWSLDDLCAAAVHFWLTIKTRQPNDNKITIYNPTMQHDGWKSSHTVIEIITQDAPFLVDSMRVNVNRLGLLTHLIIHMGGIRLSRDASGQITAIYPRHGDTGVNASIEAPIFMTIDRQNEADELAQLRSVLLHALHDNHAVVDDWQRMRDNINESMTELDHAPSSLNASEVEETKLFLHWIEDHHFTFLGMMDYNRADNNSALLAVPHSGLGILRDFSATTTLNALTLNDMMPQASDLLLSSQIIVMSKTNTMATVHRDAYTDYIGIKRFNQHGEVIGERRVIGLYTSAAYNTNPRHIPFLRHKVALIMSNSLLNPRSHAGKVLLNILETFPRDDLIQTSEDELLELAMGIFHMQERRCIRLFTRTDVYRRFVSCLVYVPKDRYNVDLRDVIQRVLSTSFKSETITCDTYFSESVLARLHFIVRINPNEKLVFDEKAIEQQLIRAGRSWADDLHALLLSSMDEERANRLYAHYKSAFPAVYMTNFLPQTAVDDIEYLEKLSNDNTLEINFYPAKASSSDGFRLKLYQRDITIALSDVLPILENLGMRAISERPYRISFGGGKMAWVNEFTLDYTQAVNFDFIVIKNLFEEAFRAVWFTEAENDGFNQLVLAASLAWREVAILRTYAKYFKQIGFTFSQDYIESALKNNALIVKQLWQMFALRFDPTCEKSRETALVTLKSAIEANLDDVANLDEDKIIRQYVAVIDATVRTNLYQLTDSHKQKHYISIKLSSALIPGLPKPHPLFEIFVYSPRFEGVHLRCAKVARGGLRWSDRREDFRTEILGLMKAQQVKNAVIVPSGAKGGFVLKQMSKQATREEISAEGIACYQNFIRGLLDITDNYQNNACVKPFNVVCYDDDDPYLVVAADKGTATFSDIANAISAEYGFWLSDAFASGGSVGYDHKKMGITAKGAWESAKRHFYELGMDIQTTDFTVVGIGDMAGDVFGNGMLLSPHIRLVAAFNHQHIFIDPNPNTAESLSERQRLFDLPRSSWADYNPALISSGGGVFNRVAKSIPVTDAMRALLGIEHRVIEPNELIQCILKASVDLLWSGGIGTFVKSERESHADVGDRTNDLIRVNALQLRAKVVGEGGNLGFTQLGRVEYALHGGSIFTDFIDNSGGVSCSDKEVNIKILLNQVIAAGDLAMDARNVLLSEMTHEVSELVLRENYLQTRVMSVLVTQSMRSFELYNRYLNALEGEGKLDRALDFIPSEKEFLERKLVGKGLTNPEIAVLLCQSKIHLKGALLASDLLEDPYLASFLSTSFPLPLQQRFHARLQTHPLRREIIATKLSNLIMNEVGFTFVYRLQDETGASASSVMRAYIIARAILGMDAVWREIELLPHAFDAKKQMEIVMHCGRLLRRTTRWFLRTKRVGLDMSAAIERYLPGIMEIKQAIPNCFGQAGLLQYHEVYDSYLNEGIPKALAHELASIRGLFSALDIIEIAEEQHLNVTRVADAYFFIGEYLELTWLRSQVIIHTTESYWEALSREILRDDLDLQQRQLTSGVIRHGLQSSQSIQACFEDWTQDHTGLMARWRSMLTNLKSSATLSYTMYFVTIRELLDFTQMVIQVLQENDR